MGLQIREKKKKKKRKEVQEEIRRRRRRGQDERAERRRRRKEKQQRFLGRVMARVKQGERTLFEEEATLGDAWIEERRGFFFQSCRYPCLDREEASLCVTYFSICRGNRRRLWSSPPFSALCSYTGWRACGVYGHLSGLLSTLRFSSFLLHPLTMSRSGWFSPSFSSLHAQLYLSSTYLASYLWLDVYIYV